MVNISYKMEMEVNIFTITINERNTKKNSSTFGKF